MDHLVPVVIHPPFARYTHGVCVRTGSDTLFCSGQLGIDFDGTVPDGIEAQTTRCLENIEAILTDAGMDRSHLVRLSSFVTDRSHLAGYMTARDQFIETIDPPPASTLLIVQGFARPEFLVEIEAIAAREP